MESKLCLGCAGTGKMRVDVDRRIIEVPCDTCKGEGKIHYPDGRHTALPNESRYDLDMTVSTPRIKAGDASYGNYYTCDGISLLQYRKSIDSLVHFICYRKGVAPSIVSFVEETLITPIPSEKVIMDISVVVKP